jgi:hypothetical protein
MSDLPVLNQSRLSQYFLQFPSEAGIWVRTRESWHYIVRAAITGDGSALGLGMS